MRRVVITGMAPVCIAGTDHETMFENMCAMKDYVTEIDKNTKAREQLLTRYCIPFPKYDESKYSERLLPVKKRGSVSAQAGVFAALSALEDAGLSEAEKNTTIFMGTGAPNMPELGKQILTFEEKNTTVRMGVPLCMSSSIASWVAIVLGTHGKATCVSNACASGNDSIGMGYESILMGKCDMSICGGSDCLYDKNHTLLKSFEYLKAVSDLPDGHSAPFSKERGGFLFSEGGAGVIILEELEHALKRNARIYAEITGYESSSDGYSIVSIREDGSVIKDMLTKLIGDKHVDYYNAHATGTVLNDTVEGKVIREIFGSKDKQPAISATKSLIGHTLGASGIIETMVCVDSIRHGKVHGSTCRTIDDDLNISCETRNIDVETAVTASFGFGGHNSCLMIEKYV